MPTRILREGILTSERVNQLSPGAEIFYRRLMSAADDYGRFSSHHSLLLAALFPLKLETVTTKDVGAWLDECETAGLVRRYSAKGKACLEILRFEQRTRSDSKYPDPDGEVRSSDGEVRSSDGQSRSKAKAKAKAKAKSETNNEGEGEKRRTLKESVCALIAAQNTNRDRPDSEIVFDRSDLLGSLEKMLGTGEWKKNVGMWKNRAKENKAALSNALEDFSAKTIEERSKIENRGAWLTKRFEQCAREKGTA